MNLKESQLDFEALLTQVVFGHGFAHYGYWPDGMPDNPSVKSLGEAQQAYFDRLHGQIPKSVKTILDVGSGTGSNAFALTEKGYQLECLCPSEQLNEMARSKLPDTVEVHTVKFEDFSTERRYDMCLFAESFHYIELVPALAQAAKYAEKHVLIFDYFRRGGSSSAGDETRGSYGDFEKVLSAMSDQFEVAFDEDLTEMIAPTFHVTDHLKNTYVAPFVGRFQSELRRNHPVYGFITNLLFKGLIRKLQRKSNRGETFARDHEYRLILLKKI